MTNKFSDSELIQLHKKKLNDGQIGDLLGVSTSVIFTRRRKLYLIANVRPRLIDKTDFDLSNKNGKEWVKEFLKSDKYKEYTKKYNQSDVYKEYLKKYYQSDKCKEYRKKYEQSDKCKEYRKKYEQSDKCKETRKKYYQKNREKILVKVREYQRSVKVVV